MKSFVALLRGINVGGNNILPMADFRDLLESQGCKEVATYIQSGNAVFVHRQTDVQLSERIAGAIESEFGFRVSVMVLAADAFRSITANNPFDDADPKSVHVWFLKETATNADTERLDELANDREDYQMADAAFYLLAPDGIGRSKLAAGIERCLGVPATARNLRTAVKINAMLDALD